MAGLEPRRLGRSGSSLLLGLMHDSDDDDDDDVLFVVSVCFCFCCFSSFFMFIFILFALVYFYKLQTIVNHVGSPSNKRMSQVPGYPSDNKLINLDTT